MRKLTGEGVEPKKTTAKKCEHLTVFLTSRALPISPSVNISMLSAVLLLSSLQVCSYKVAAPSAATKLQRRLQLQSCSAYAATKLQRPLQLKSCSCLCNYKVAAPSAATKLQHLCNYKVAAPSAATKLQRTL
jgi:hypothetical protein